MSKVIKVKQSDIIKIVNNVIFEQIDDFDGKIQPEELPQTPDFDYEDETEEDRQVPQFLIGKDKTGRIGVVNTKTGEILTTK